jgi:hypothetical protein
VRGIRRRIGSGPLELAEASRASCSAAEGCFSEGRQEAAAKSRNTRGTDLFRTA